MKTISELNRKLVFLVILVNLCQIKFSSGQTYCDSKGNSQADEWISQVSIGSFTNSSGKELGGYSNFTSKIINVNPGTSYSITLTPGFSQIAYTEYFKIWIDYNKDGDFVDSGEEVYTSPATNAPISGTISIPAMQAISTRLRVSMKYNAPPTSCETFSYGEVEDYSVQIGAGSLPALSVNNVSVNENAGNVVFTVSLNQTSASAVSGNYATSNNTAVAGIDYSAKSGTFSIPAGSLNTTISITILDDAIAESSETFNFTISNPANATISSATGVCTIADNDAAALPTISVNNISVSENSGTANFTISLNQTSASVITGNYSTSNNTALSGSDYSGSSGSFSISAGSLNTTIGIAILNDATVESTETFNLTISNIVNATISTGTGICTITDDDSNPSTGDITAVYVSTGLSGGGTSGDVTISAQNTSALWNANLLQGRTISAGVPSTGQVLKWDGIQWAPGTDNSGAGSSQWITTGSSIYYSAGNVGIGTSLPDQKLTVKGKIHAEEVIVDLSVPGPDYVFEPGYNLLSLNELEKYLKQYKHLPGFREAKVMEENGISLSEMNMLLLKKLEETILYILQQEKRISELEAKLK